MTQYNQTLPLCPLGVWTAGDAELGSEVSDWGSEIRETTAHCDAQPPPTHLHRPHRQRQNSRERRARHGSLQTAVWLNRPNTSGRERDHQKITCLEADLQSSVLCVETFVQPPMRKNKQTTTTSTNRGPEVIVKHPGCRSLGARGKGNGFAHLLYGRELPWDPPKHLDTSDINLHGSRSLRNKCSIFQFNWV